MTPKHTPGPWTAEYNPDTECWEVNEPYDGLHCPTMFEGSQADARLIAAARDLLQAVKDALDVISDMRAELDRDQPRMPIKDRLQQLIDQIEED